MKWRIFMENISARIKNMSNGVRWGIAIGALLILLGISVMCAMTGMLMMAFSTDSCSGFTEIVNVFFYLPPVMLALGSLLGPLLFAFRRPIKWALLTMAGCYGLSILLYIAWFPVLLSQC
jgi:hypothetical protein